MQNKPQFIIVHHSASSRDHTNIDQINAWHKARGFPQSSLGYYVGYHYVIFPDGKVFQARNDLEIGAHAKTADGMNFKSIGICLAGNYETEELTIGNLDALKNLTDRLCMKYAIPHINIRGHRDVSQTACPGNNLYKFIKEYRIIIFNRDVAYGEMGAEVKILQEALRKFGFYGADLQANGVYDEQTRKAVLGFQMKYAVAPIQELNALNGRRAGPKTRAKLNELLK